MLDWIQSEIDEWKKYLRMIEDHTPIPWQLQAGKLLEKYDGDVEKAIAVARYQANQDAQGAAFASNTYWLKVIDYLMKKRVNDLILGE